MRLRRWDRRAKVLAAATVLAAGLAVPAVDAARLGASTPAATTLFDRPGTYTYVVPPDMNQLEVDALGGTGGDLTAPGSGGRGGRVQAVLAVTPGQALTVIVGGAGGNSPGYGGGPGNGDGGAGYVGAAGGGASTVKSGTTRLVVAGGGGGPGDPLVDPRPCGGHGGGTGTPDGADGCGGFIAANGAQGGTASGGGTRGCFPGETAVGPDGGDGWGGGGGGGGWFGGGGSCMNGSIRSGGGGGGGSSYATPASLTPPVFSVGAAPDDEVGVSFMGNGYVRLTAVSDVYLPVEIKGHVGFPSGHCSASGGQQVVDTTTQGVRAFVYTRVVSTRRVDVCWRVEDSGGAGKGGRLITRVALPDAGGVGTPSVDGAATSCTTTTDPPNQVPGSHPVAAGGVGGVPYSFDAYSDGATTAWACARVGVGIVNHRVVVPVALADPEGSPIVEWQPDLGT